MQDPKTGNMIPVDQPTAEQAIKLGYCIISVGELVELNGTFLKVKSFDKKHIMLDFVQEGVSPFKYGEKVTINNGTFIVESCGTKFLRLRGLPAVTTVDQVVIDEIKKKQVKDLRK
jgi:hypothetical protein